ncbi:MAG: amidohydrolase, partial [Candidatus Aminicenantes bacterium]|nr:amidohydrolase [Candidatus Aminicenantes bacterium]
MKTGNRLLCLTLSVGFFSAFSSPAVDQKMDGRVDAIVARITPALVEIRRDIHCHPELSMEETRTAALVAEYFRNLGFEVRTG